MSEHAPAADHADHGHGGHHEDHTEHYRNIYLMLLGLLVVSVVGPFVGEATGIFIITLLTAFGIAFVKAWLVIKHFMHVTDEPPFVWYILATGLVFMVLFFAGTSPDVLNHEGTNWKNVAAEAEVARGLAAGSGHHGDDHGGDHGAAHDDGHGKKAKHGKNKAKHGKAKGKHDKGKKKGGDQH